MKIFLVAHQPFLGEVLARIIRDEGHEMLHIVRVSGWDLAEIIGIGSAQPDVVVAVVGYTIQHELQALVALRRHAPGCRVLVIDTMADARPPDSDDLDVADILLRPDQVLSSLVPAICCLTAAATRT